MLGWGQGLPWGHRVFYTYRHTMTSRELEILGVSYQHNYFKPSEEVANANPGSSQKGGEAHECHNDATQGH